jgi:YidC/Oxa1 family membrane protein insertase
MDNYRAFLAIAISFVILIAYQYFFDGFGAKTPADTKQGTAIEQVGPKVEDKAAPAQDAALRPATIAKPKAVDRNAKQITIDTDLYTAVVSEQGGTLQNFVLKKYKETDSSDSPGKQLIKTDRKSVV